MSAGRPRIPVTLSTSSVYPENAAYAFDLAERLGFDGVEVMVWSDPVTQNAAALHTLSNLHDQPIRSIHAPTLLFGQRIWGLEPWGKIDRSLELAAEVGADVVVAHPPFRWQREYAQGFVDGVAQREEESGLAIAVENMFPWRARDREMLVYAPDWDPTDQPFEHLTLDLSHAATSGLDALDLLRLWGPRTRHVHLGDGSGSFRDEHLVPGQGVQPCREVLGHLVETGWTGTVALEVGTRRMDTEAREKALTAGLAFARATLPPVA